MNIDYKNIERKNKLSKVEVDYLLYGNKYPFLVEQLNTMKATHDCGCGHGVQVAGSLSLVRSTATGKVISLDPKLGQGYLVMNRANNPNVNLWRVFVSSAVIEKGKLIRQQEVERKELHNGINWWKMPRRYLSAERAYTVSVQGVSSSNSIVVEEGPLLVSNTVDTGVALESGGTPWLPGCKWICNGNGYAWEIRQALHPLGYNSQYLWLTSAYLLFDEATQLAVPYYSYMPQDVFQQLFNQEIPYLTHGVDWVGPIQSSVTGPTTLRTDDGAVIVGDAFGIRKTLGPWSGEVIQTTHIPNPHVGCEGTRGWAIQQINANALVNPSLECVPSWQDSGFSGGISQSTASCMFSAVQQMIGIDTNTNNFPMDNILEDINQNPNFVTNYSAAITTCYCQQEVTLACNDLAPTNPAKWAEIISNLTISSLSDKSWKAIEIDYDIFSEKNISSRMLKSHNRFTLSPGLYCFGTSFRNGFYLPLIMEVSKSISGHCELK
jgi:hypothetical protein